MKSIGILGSTGSIGASALEVIRSQKDFFKVTVLAAGSNDRLLEEQALEFRPEVVALFDEEKARGLEKRLQSHGIRVVAGEEGLIVAATWKNTQQMLFSFAGSRGLLPLYEAIEAGKNVAVANKEPLVMAGSLIMRLVEEKQVEFMPVDSEHSAIWQCLEGHSREDLARIHLTASGGPFLNFSEEELSRVSPQEALKHPRWEMGKKITVDSATLMNKGLEVIEAVNLFDLKPSEIEILIHPESIVHSLVEFKDGSFLAQLSTTDMKLPIQYALAYPKRLASNYPVLDLTSLGKLTFLKPDFKKFPSLELAYDAAETGGTSPAVLNAVNEVAVEAFLEGKISFLQITGLIETVIEKHQTISEPDLTQILEADVWARETAREVLRERILV